MGALRMKRDEMHMGKLLEVVSVGEMIVGVHFGECAHGAELKST